MKLLLDMNLPPALADSLSRSGLEAVHWAAIGDIRASDSTLLGFAASSGYVVVTHDLDLGAILAASGGSGPSVIILRTDALGVADLADRLLALVSSVGDELRNGAIVTVGTSRTRVRLLPLR